MLTTKETLLQATGILKKESLTAEDYQNALNYTVEAGVMAMLEGSMTLFMLSETVNELAIQRLREDGFVEEGSTETGLYTVKEANNAEPAS